MRWVMRFQLAGVPKGGLALPHCQMSFPVVKIISACFLQHLKDHLLASTPTEKINIYMYLYIYIYIYTSLNP